MPHSNGHLEVNGVNGYSKPHKFDSIEATIEAFCTQFATCPTPEHAILTSYPARGEFVVVLDNPHRENEGDLIIAAEDATTVKLSFMIRYTSGYICAPLPPSRCKSLELPPMVAENQDPHRTAYTITVDANMSDDEIPITTGISAHDRAVTARKLADPSSIPSAFRRPGHMIPLQARPGGVRQRQGHTEAAIELCRLAGKRPAALLCEMVLDGEEVVRGRAEFVGGGMMRRDDCLEFGRRWGLKVCTIEDLVAYVEKREGPLPMNALV